jgi:hypothetical protein
LTNLGNLASERGRPAEGERLYRQALAIKERQAPGSALVAVTLSNLGELAELRRDLPAAADLYERARQLLEKVAPGGPALAVVLGNWIPRDRRGRRAGFVFVDRK